MLFPSYPWPITAPKIVLEVTAEGESTEPKNLLRAIALPLVEGLTLSKQSIVATAEPTDGPVICIKPPLTVLTRGKTLAEGFDDILNTAVPSFGSGT